MEVFRREAVIAGHTAVQGFSTDAMDELYRQDWPGNIRELRNSVFRAMVLAGDGLLDRSHLLGILPRDGAELAEPETGQRPASREPTSEIPAPEPPPPAAVPAPGDPESGGSQTAALSGRLARLLELIAARGSLSNQEYAREAGVSLRTGLRDLNDLLDSLGKVPKKQRSVLEAAWNSGRQNRLARLEDHGHKTYSSQSETIRITDSFLSP